MQNEFAQISVNENKEQSFVPISHQRAFYFFLKRTFDLVVAIIGLIVLIPFLLLIALIIRLDSPGPVFFIQKRVCMKKTIVNGSTQVDLSEFSCYKFRTMVHNADPAIHKAFVQALINNEEEKIASMQQGDTKLKKLTNDHRITRIGKFLRKASIDEFPQLINVIKGEMSLVGPRPAILYEVQMYKPWYRRRLEAKPGITGLWQVTARSSADFDEMVKLDIEYIERQSFLLDMLILIKTPLVVFSCKGAV
jgi:lipopolysaccharide/colanic/teichoic acid biosynthesis glycosyltransferase